jgi:hypothetical protein
VYGQEREVPHEVALRYAQQGAAFQQQREELQRARAEHEKEVAAWKDRLKKDPAGLMKEAELDPKGWAADYLIEQHQRSQETPEQQQARADREELARLKAEKTEAEQRAQAEKSEAVRQRRMREIGQTFVSALKEGGVPEGPASWPYVSKMAGYQEEIDARFLAGELTPEEAQQASDPKLLAKLATEDLRAEQAALFGKLRGDELAAVMGDEWLNRAAEAWVMREERKRAATQAQGGAGAVPVGVQLPSAQSNSNGAGRPRDPTTGKFLPSRERTMFEEITGIRR